jgi:hypothetical protein
MELKSIAAAQTLAAPLGVAVLPEIPREVPS